MTRRTARWANDVPEPPDRVDHIAAELRAELDHFKRAVLAWLVVAAAAAGVLVLLTRHVTVDEATGAWLMLIALLTVIVALVRYATRSDR